MSNLLQTILFGTFLPPDVPGRQINFDQPKNRHIDIPVRLRGISTRDAVIQALKSDTSNWFAINDISEMAGVCRDTAMKVLNQLASEQLVIKRREKIAHRGHPTVIFKWMKKSGKKQKTA